MHVRIGMVGGHKELIDGVLIHAAVNATMPRRRIKVDEAVSKCWLLLGLIWVKECPKNKKSRARTKKKSFCPLFAWPAQSPMIVECALDVFSRHDSYTERWWLLLQCSYCWIYFTSIFRNIHSWSTCSYMMYLPWHLVLLKSRSRGSCIVIV